MFNEGLTGTSIHNANPRFRMYAVVIMTIFALGSILFWRAQLFVSTEYVELPNHGKTVKKAKANAFTALRASAPDDE